MMNNNFKDVMSQKSNEELAEILKLHKEDYQPEAIKYAESEFNNRNLSLENFFVFKKSDDVNQDNNKKYINNTYKDLVRPFIGILVLLVLGFFMVKEPYLMEDMEEEGRKMFLRVFLKAIWGIPAGIIALLSSAFLLYTHIQTIRGTKK